MKNKWFFSLAILAVLFLSLTACDGLWNDSSDDKEDDTEITQFRITGYTRYYADGSIDIYVTYEYDSSGNQFKACNYDSDGSINEYSITEYNSDGNKIKRTRYDSDGAIIEYYSYEYNADGNNVKINYYSPVSIFRMLTPSFSQS